MTTSHTADWRLRAVLVVALVALLVSAWAVRSTPSPAKTLTAVTRDQAPAGNPAPMATTTTMTTPATTMTTPATTMTTPPTTMTTPATTASPVTTTGATGTAPGPVAVARAGARPGRPTREGSGRGCGFSLERHVPAPVGHCTVLEIGDSLGNDIGWGLGRHISAGSGLDLVQLDRSATGLANSSFYNWPAELPSDVHRYRPQLVLICLGGNDDQGMQVGSSAVQFPSPAWKKAYIARVRRLVSEAAASGAYVLWVGMPIMQQPSYSHGMQILNALFRQGVASSPNGTFISTWSLFSGPRGAFQSDAVVNGTPTSLRQPDGIHYSFAGEDVVATYVVRELASVYHVRLAPKDPAVITSWG